MKKTIALTMSLASLLSLTSFAQNPAPPAPPAQTSIPAAPAPPAPPANPIHHNGPKEPVTFLGVETSQVPRVLSEQLGLPRDFGVVIDYVSPDSPASAAGLQRSDIIRMLNDQLIVGPGQLGVLVRSFADGTTINLTLLRKGQEVKVPVKLAKHDVSMGHGFRKDWDFDDFDKMDFDFQAPDVTAVREAVSTAVAQAQAEAKRAGDEMRRATRRLRVVTRDDDDTTKSTRIDLGKATITFSDEKGELKMERVDGRKMLTAKDAQGKVLFNGPIDTQEERARLPAGVRERFEKLENQELPAVPTAPQPPEPPEPPQPPGEDETACLEAAPRIERASLSPNKRSGWRRSSIIL